jgi:hypothetical protein
MRNKNVLAVYARVNNPDILEFPPSGLKWQEQHLYGSSRIGMWRPGVQITDGIFPLPGNEYPNDRR